MLRPGSATVQIAGGFFFSPKKGNRSKNSQQQ
jgi:hypothetical protein